ncbi:hypothetical protein [Tardiphaga sp. 862_B3_N1_1]|uniref:hypothetical protein n=1 Tax=Tardiphaga sp. 862_B3_N1_1 TaxID=3240763 RepID=UPI003F8940D1
MTTVFTRETPESRVAATEHGDTLQSIAGRELGDANRWPELAWINHLRSPYITDNPARAGDGVLLTGAFIKIPAPKGVRTDAAELGQVFQRDAELRGKQLQVTPGGDFAVLTGSKNLAQQLTHRLATPRGQAVRHPKYGSLLYRLIGRINGPTGALMAQQYASAAIKADFRVRSIKKIDATVKIDAIDVQARAETIAGGPIDIKTDLT